jgi:hypothetical protein
MIILGLNSFSCYNGRQYAVRLIDTANGLPSRNFRASDMDTVAASHWWNR